MRVAVVFCLLVFAVARVGASPLGFRFTDAKGQPVADVVVSLVPLGAPATPQPPAAPLEIMQQGEEFSPYVTALVVGTAVNFPNRDVVQHHVYSLSKPKKFELPLYAGESKAAIVFDRPGVVALGCNIHDWMAAYIVVLATPWFAKTGTDGTAAIADAPAGRYRAEVWHPRLGKPETREVSLVEGTAASETFVLTLKPDRRIRRAVSAGAKGYK